MAIYHLTAKTVSRGGASSAKTRSEYIDRAGRYQNDAAEVLYKESGNMPDWAENSPVRYWEAADKNERANGRLFKQLEFALPIELSADQQREVATSFCREVAQTRDGPLPYSFAVHKGGHECKNPHCHLMLSERVTDGHNRSPETWFRRASKNPEKGGSRKTEELKPAEWLYGVRDLWEKRANQALEHAGHAVRIDHRSLKAQGIEDREPTWHLGPAAAAMERKGMKTDRGAEQQKQKTEQTAIKAMEIEITSLRLENVKKIEPDGFSVKNKAIIKNSANAFGLTMEKLTALADEQLKNIARANQQKIEQPLAQERQRGLER